MSEALLELEGVGKEFVAAGRTVRILHDIALSVAPGETLAVTGPSGSGKSTLLGVMAGLERPSAGSVRWRGASFAAWDEEALSAWRRKSVGFVFQSFRLVASLTALENVALPLEIAGLGADEAQSRGAALLRTLGLEGRGGHFPHQLSGGEQQRVAIARAFVHGPELVFADEPTGSLDRDTAQSVLEALFALNAEKGAALVLVTHDPALAARVGRTFALVSGSVAR